MSSTSGSSLPACLAGYSRAGRQSAIVKEIRKLTHSAAERRRRKIAVVEGLAPAAEILHGHFQVLHALASPRLASTPQGEALAGEMQRLGDRARRVDDKIMATLSGVEASQGILLVINRPRWDLKAVLDPEPCPVVLVAHGIQDPGNLGALARVTEASWCTAMVCIGGADPWSLKAVRASAGSIPRLPVVEAGGAPRVLEDLKRAGLRLMGTTPHDAPSYRDTDLSGPLALVVGSEGKGLPSRVTGKLDTMISIPLKEGVESLNVAASAAVLLFHRLSSSDGA